MSKLPYFKFHTSKWINGDVTLESLELQGLFVNICAYYWSKDGVVTEEVLLKRFRGYEDLIVQLIDVKIIKTNDGYINISFLNEQLESKEVQKYVNQENGKKGGAPKGNANAKRKDTTDKQPNGLNNTHNKQPDINPNTTNIEKSKEEYSKEEKIIEDNKGGNNKTVSSKPAPPKDFKSIASKSFENNSCPFGTEFKKNWLLLLQTKKWRTKDQSAINMSLKKLMDFDESFANVLVENTIAGGYQGVVFSDTDANYQKYLKSKDGNSNSRESAIESRRRMEGFARQILAAD